jgi:selenocysteine lyase/cysteine desulfurase
MARDFELDQWRADTPGCAYGVHLDNAGSSLAPRSVTDAVVAHVQREAEIGGYRAEEEHQALLDDAYTACADLIGARSEEIALVESATAAWQMAFHSIPFTDGDRILTCVAEYASNYLGYLRLARSHRIAIDVVPDDEHGQIDVAQAAAMVTDRTRLISITHVPTNGGLVNPAAEIGTIARANRIPYLLDACQSVGQMPIDVNEIGCDFLSFTGRKFVRGPRGTGALFVRATAETADPAFIDLHSATWTEAHAYRVRGDARRFENYERDVAAHIGLGVAARYAQQVGVEHAWTRIQALGRRLRGGLSAVDGVAVRDKGSVLCGIVTFDVAGLAATAVEDHLAQHAITVNVTRRPSTLIDMTRRGLDEMVRASVHYFNTEDEVDRTVQLVADLARGSARR